MPTAEIITIGTELLLGEIVDTNTRFIARALRDEGVDIFRTATVGDNVERIAEIMGESLSRAEIVITTGGLGPTVDDPTREAAALAFGVESEFRPELWEQIKARFREFGHIPTENNKRQAYIPHNARALENLWGTAPAFLVEREGRVLISLPGVPYEMKNLLSEKVMPYLQSHFDLNAVIKSRSLHTVGIGESRIDDLIGDFERLENPTVGLAAHRDSVGIRITAKAKTDKEAIALIEEIEEQLREILAEWIVDF
ncbi:MAG: Nicotinamide-nucleotide amidohydrolase PncC [Chloroflexi bacterium]|nr:Nicotinamide-nucleotide amidohydrolase PncC [Chloroflexota bacterium]